MLDNTLALRAVGFPLNESQVIDGIFTPEQQDALKLIESDVYMSNTHTIKFRAYSGEYIVRIEAHVQRQWYYLRNENIMFNLAALDDNLAEAFQKWLDENLTWARKVRVAKELVTAFMAHGNKYHGGSMASINTRWPELMVVPLHMTVPWPERARSIPVIKRTEYGWSETEMKTWNWFVDNSRKMEIVGGMLVGAQTLSTIKDNSPATAKVVDWQVDPTRKPAA